MPAFPQCKGLFYWSLNALFFVGSIEISIKIPGGTYHYP